MIVVRIVKGITGHFPSRAPEWALAVILFNWGWMLLRSDDTFASPVYAELAQWASEQTWGTIGLLIGGLRIAALVINGTFLEFRHSPHLRSFMAFISCFCWCSITLGMLRADVTALGMAVFPVLLVLDMWNAYRAAIDAREADEVARNARST